MPQLDELLSLCKREQFAFIPPTWCVVNFLLLRHAGLSDVHMGAVVVASGEVAVFSYNPHDFAPMYFGTIGGSERLQQVTGYRHHGIGTKDPEEAYQFIRSTIDAGQGVAVAGPEMGICYGYEDADIPNERTIFGIADWGPGFDGIYTWAKFCEYVDAFGMNEGFFTVERVESPGVPVTVVGMLAETATVWQDRHPATAYGMGQENYGMQAFRRYIDDVADPEVRKTIDSPYINCHALLFQHAGRYWLGMYLKEVSDQLPARHRALASETATLYLYAAAQLQRFQEYNILEGKSEDEIAEASTWLEDAYRTETHIVANMNKLRA